MRNRWWLAPLTAGLLFLATAASAEETETAEKSETTETTGTDEAPPPPPPPPDPAAEELKKTIAELQRQLQELQDWKDEQELRALQQSAETEAASEVEETLEDRTYIQGVRSLQMLNPEISVSGDFLFQLALDENDSFYYATDDRSGLPLRAVDVHIQSSLDPFSLFKSALGFAPEGGV